MGKSGMSWDAWLAIALVLIGAINWGLVGFFRFNLVETIFGVGVMSRIIYGIVGVAGIWSAIKLIFD